MSKRIQLNIIDLGGGTTKGCDCEELDLSAYAKKDDVPTKVSQLENDSGFMDLNNKISIQTGGSISEVTIINQLLTCSNTPVDNVQFSDSWTGDEWEAKGGYYEYATLFYGDSPLPITASRWVCKDGKITGYIDDYETGVIDVPIGNQSYKIRHWFQEEGSTRIIVKKTEDSRTYQEFTIIEAIKFINEKTL